jgi:hypothetical protein
MTEIHLYWGAARRSPSQIHGDGEKHTLSSVPEREKGLKKGNLGNETDAILSIMTTGFPNKTIRAYWIR